MNRSIDLSGKTIGGLHIARAVGRDNKRRCAIWECLCSCGKSIELNSSALLRRAKRKTRDYGCGCTRRFTSGDIERLLLDKREIDTAIGCWNWTGNTTPEGYGRIGFIQSGKQQRDVHRVAAHLWLGMDLDADVFVCHHCDNPSCFNPEHLFIGDNSANIKDCADKGRHTRGQQFAAKTHCPQGHPYSGENLIKMASRSRACRECMRDRSREYQRKKRNVSAALIARQQIAQI